MNAPQTQWTEPHLFRLTLDDVEKLDRAGAFDGRGRVQLIEGVLIAMSPQARSHVYAKTELTYRLRVALEGLRLPLTALTEPTVKVSSESAPEPDVALTSAPRGVGYVPVDSVALVIEVADSTLRLDMRDKRDLYARAGVPEYWVVDVNKAVVHRFADPKDGVYRAEPPIPLAGELSSLTIPDLAITGDDIL